MTHKAILQPRFNHTDHCGVKQLTHCFSLFRTKKIMKNIKKKDKMLKPTKAFPGSSLFP